jgi:hypothetical protein
VLRVGRLAGGDTGRSSGHWCQLGAGFSAAQGSGPGGLGAGPQGGLPDTFGRRTSLYTGGVASVAALASDQRLPASVAVVRGGRRGNGAGGTGAWAGGGMGASPAGGAGELGGAGGATITAPMNATSNNVKKSRKKNRAAFIWAAWVIGRLRCPAVASPVTNSAGIISRGNTDATGAVLAC